MHLLDSGWIKLHKKQYYQIVSFIIKKLIDRIKSFIATILRLFEKIFSPSIEHEINFSFISLGSTTSFQNIYWRFHKKTSKVKQNCDIAVLQYELMNKKVNFW